MKTFAKTLLAAGVGLFGSLGAAQAAPYSFAADRGILPGGCYGDTTCSTGNCTTGNCSTGNCTTSTWPRRYDDYAPVGRYDDYRYGHDRYLDGVTRHDHWDQSRYGVGLSNRPFNSRFDSRYDRFDNRRNDGLSYDGYSRTHMFEPWPGHLNVSNPGHPVRNW